MMKIYRKHLIASAVVIILPAIIGILLGEFFPQKFVTHWNFMGQADRMSNKGFDLLGISFVLLLSQWIGLFFTMKDQKNENQSKKVFIMIIWIFPIISLLLWIGIYSSVIKSSLDISKIILLTLPLMFIIIGNYMPKCKQNYSIGIRITWTLRNEENWNKTHRLAGKVWVYGGILMMLLLLLIPTEKAVNVIWIGIFFLVFVPMIYSYLYYKKQLEKGEVTKEEMKASLVEKKITLGVILTVIVIVLLVFQGDYEIQLGSTSLFIDAKYWKDMTISYEEIDEVKYVETKEKGTRMFGYGTPFLVMGECRNSVWGSYTAYLHEKTKPCIFLRVSDKILVINGEDEESTKEYYEQLRVKVAEEE